jgi:DNA gyrase subunit A
VVGAVAVTEADELMLMTSTGQSIRIRVSDIRETGRVAQGVKLLTLKPGEKLQDISLVIPDGEDSESSGSISIEASESPGADIDKDPDADAQSE